MSRRTKELLEELGKAEARLVQVDREREEAKDRVEALKADLAAAAGGARFSEDLPQPLPGAAPSGESTVASSDDNEPSVPKSPLDKVRLFRRLFRGRNDIFPTRFVSKKTGRAGYAPACSNKFVRGVCELPRIKCGACSNQAFVSVSDELVMAHLQGRHVMGVYPLLEDETCWFLAVDFDGTRWRDDVLAFRETCRTIGVTSSVERSHSGNGAHAWFFFVSPLPAGVARTMGCYLITETMSRRHELGMESYDRLFPNQDTMPRGGFGNLIALPLQYDARKRGNTVFLDEQLEPYGEQWKYLASVSRVDPQLVQDIGRQALQRGLVVGVRSTEPTDEAETPRTLPLSSGVTDKGVIEGIPATVDCVLSDRLYIVKTALPSALLTQIKRLAAFQNPEFYKKEKMRLSTATTPRIIDCSKECSPYIALPRGCLSDLVELLARHGSALSLGDQRVSGEPLEFSFRGDLTPVQEQAARALIQHETGVLVAPPGVGKTVLGAYMVAARRRNTLVLVHRQPLLDQWVMQLSVFLGVDEREIGRIGGGQRKPNGRLDVAMLQSLVRSGQVDDLVAAYGHVIVDECHHVPAVSFERALSAVKARNVLGLTATPQRRDGHDPILRMQLGPVRFTVDPRSRAARRPFEHRLIVRNTSFRLDTDDGPVVIQRLYRSLSADEGRNRLILDDVIRAVDEGRSPILLTERRDHLVFFASRLQSFVRHLVVLHGGRNRKQRTEAASRLSEIPDDEERLVLATGRYAGEGFDDARLDTLFLAMPVSWKGTIVQYAGRLHRLHPAKKEVRIVDYVDRAVPMLQRMFERRLRGYRALGYVPDEAPLEYVPVEGDPIVELDVEALRHFDSVR
jgi:superfamily II DNA or RNA helicase